MAVNLERAGQARSGTTCASAVAVSPTREGSSGGLITAKAWFDGVKICLTNAALPLGLTKPCHSVHSVDRDDPLQCHCFPLDPSVFAAHRTFYVLVNSSRLCRLASVYSGQVQVQVVTASHMHNDVALAAQARSVQKHSEQRTARLGHMAIIMCFRFRLLSLSCGILVIAAACLCTSAQQ